MRVLQIVAAVALLCGASIARADDGSAPADPNPPTTSTSSGAGGAGGAGQGVVPDGICAYGC